MAQPDRMNVTPLASRRARPRSQGEHAWLVPHLISLIGYAERHGLAEVDHALTEAAERIAQHLGPGPEVDRPSSGDRLVVLSLSRPEGRD